MSRIVTVGAAQLGPVQRADSRAAVVARMLDLLRQAGEHRCDLVVFPELALTTFFPRWWMEDQDEIDAFFEREMPSNETAPLFNEARARGIGFYLGFAELARENGATRRFNTSILVDGSGREVGRYRKIHLPGHAEHEPWRAFQHLEKRYFEIGDLGWPVWRAMGGLYGMCICNDRRWPETYRTMGLQGVEMVLLGYNTPRHNPPAPDHDRLSEFHNQLSMQAGAYANATWVVGVAKCGVEEGCEMIGNSSIIAPTGEVVAQALTQGDELVIARCDLDLGKQLQGDDLQLRAPPPARAVPHDRRAPGGGGAGVIRLHVHAAVAELAPRVTAKRRLDDPAVERRHDGGDEPARQRTDRGVAEPFEGREREFGRRAAGLQLRRGDLQHPGGEQDQEHPAVVPAQAPRHRLPPADEEDRPAQILAERPHPAVLALDPGREDRRIVVALEPADTAPVDVEEAVAARLDGEQQQHQHHREEHDAVVRGRGRERHRQHGADDGDRPIAGAVDAVAPSGHAGDLGAVVMRQHGDELRPGAREHRPDEARRRFRSGSGFGCGGFRLGKLLVPSHGSGV